MNDPFFQLNYKIQLSLEEKKERYKILFSLKARSLISNGISSDFITNSFSIYEFTMDVSYPL